MYYQPRSAHYCLGPYQPDTEEKTSRPSQHAACMWDSIFHPSSSAAVGGSTGNFAVSRPNSAIQTGRRPETDDFDGLHRARNDGRGGIPASEPRMTSSYRDDVTWRGDEIRSCVLPRPSPYDCKPPYSYISLITMAIENSPHRRFIYLQFHQQGQF